MKEAYLRYQLRHVPVWIVPSTRMDYVTGVVVFASVTFEWRGGWGWCPLKSFRRMISCRWCFGRLLLLWRLLLPWLLPLLKRYPLFLSSSGSGYCLCCQTHTLCLEFRRAEWPLWEQLLARGSKQAACSAQ